jgi:hypothetical protein
MGDSRGFFERLLSGGYVCLILRVTLAVTSLCASGLHAQTFGEITGRVTDSSGAVMARASITLTNTNTNAIRKAISTEAGVYSFPSVPPGSYKLSTEVTGFKSWASEPFQVQVQQVVRVDVVLQVGQASQTIEVAAIADLLQSATATLGSVIDNRSVTELPLNGRQYLNLVSLSPNVNVLAPAAGQAGSRQGGDRAQQSISTGGQRIFYNYYTLDGVNNMDVNFNSYVTLPSIDAIQEFKVQNGVYPAEFGHESTQVNVLTKSGGNAYHGALFEFLRNDAMDAKDYRFPGVPVVKTLKWNDYGFELDGPVRIPHLFNGHDRLFFMSNYEAFRNRRTRTNKFTVPTTKMFGGDFSELLPSTIIYDPTTGLPFPGNIVPIDRLDPTSLKFLKYYNSANTLGAQNFAQNDLLPVNRDGFVLRMDFNESSKSQWMGRYNWGDENTVTQTLNLAGTKVLTNYEQYAGSNTRTFTARLVNEARFGYTRFFNSLGTLSAGKLDAVSDIGIPNQSPGAPITWGIPNVVFSGSGGLTAIGDANDGPFKNDNNTLQFVDKVSWIHGKHSFAFGFEYDRQNFNQLGNQFSRGVFTFQPFATRNPADGSGGYGFAEFLLGDLSVSTTAAAVANAKFQRNVEHAFIDDTWKVTPKLTLSLGLRYELTPPFTNTLGNYFTVEIPKFITTPNAPQADWPFFVRQSGCTDPYQGLSIHWTQTNAVCGGGLNHNLMQTKYKSFAPRVGVAFSPDEKTVIRTGFGIYFMEDIANSTYFDMARNIAARVDLTSSSTSQYTWGNAIPGGNGTTVQVGPPFAWAAAYDHATPYTMQYLLNVQRQLGANWVLEAGYLGSLSRHLYGFRNVNQAGPGPLTNISSRVPFPNFGVLSYVNDTYSGNYNAGSVKLTRRFSQGVSLITNYTWSKSIDNSSGTRTQGYDILFPQDSTCLQCERALSSFDVRHRWVLAAVYDLPVGKGKILDIGNPVLNGFVGGWQLSANTTIQSGVPQTLSSGGNLAGTNNPVNDRPSFSGVGNGYLSNHGWTSSGLAWYNPASFILQPQGNFGSVGRNTMITPAFQTFDLAVHKNFPLAYKDGHVLQFRLEAFNVLNHPVWSAPNGNVQAGKAIPGAPSNAPHDGFGIISTTALDMRQLQLGLKYTF